MKKKIENLASINTRLNINWPASYEPKNRKVHVHNAIVIDARREVVWEWLVRAECWPDWYSNSKNVVIIDSIEPHKLTSKCKFRWTTFGINLQSFVDQYAKEKVIAWEAVGFLVHAYHAWELEEIDETHCLVITEERQYGIGAWIFHWVFPRRMWQKHHLWLTQLKKMAESYPPPSKIINSQKYGLK